VGSRKRCFIVENGQTTPEYAVVLTIVAVAVAGLFIAFAGGIQGAITTVSGVL
jgi:Flp pilus assembly pilin Flp